MSNWDEDSVTMSVEAARRLLGPEDDRSHVDNLFLASTTMPFADRLRYLTHRLHILWSAHFWLY